MSWSYRPALDGLRFVAVYLVLLFHSGVVALRGGFVGVDMFFVLSGFLVSNVLLGEIDEHGRLRLGRFYARRVRRLLPAAVVVVTATSTVFLLTKSVVFRLPLVRDAQSALLYVANWRFLQQQNDYFATGADKSPFLHFWSLAIEEQFYLLFPLVLLLLALAGRRRAWLPFVGLGGLLLVSLGLQLYWSGADPNHAYYGTDARLYQLLAGALLACAMRAWQRPRRAVPRWAGAVGMLALLGSASALLDVGPSGRGIVAAAASVLLVAGVTGHPDGPLARALSRRTPVYLGRVSYGTYLWHWPTLLVVREVLHVRPLVLAVLAAALSTGLAALSYEVFELPIRRAPALHRFEWRAALTGLTVSALVAAFVVPPMLGSARKPRLVRADHLALAAGGRSEPRRAVPQDIDWKAVAHDIGPAATCRTAEKCPVVRGDGPHVLLVGDSHARMLAPMFEKLAREHGLTLSLNTIAACPWQADVVNLNQPPAARSKCIAGRGAWYRTVLPRLHPDLVVLATHTRDEAKWWGPRLKRIGGSDESLAELNRATTRETLATITATGARALIVTNMLGTGDLHPLACLAKATYLSDCRVPTPMVPPASDAYYRSAAVASDQVYTVDVNPVLCPAAPLCEPMLDGDVVWRNHDHFTTQVLVHHRRQIWAAIRASGALDGLS